MAFNPFSLQIVRVVDSQGKELFLDVVSPRTDVAELSRKPLSEPTALGRLMTDLGVSELRDLSAMMAGRSPTWVGVYRDLCEWATLYDLVCDHDFAADTLVVRDGLLRATIFTGDTLVRVGRLLRAARCETWWAGTRRTSSTRCGWPPTWRRGGTRDPERQVKLFEPGKVVGVFRGFSDSGMEFHADLVLPYREELQSIPCTATLRALPQPRTGRGPGRAEAGERALLRRAAGDAAE